jgi:hypothetical protein
MSLSQEQIKVASDALVPCPFCGGKADFLVEKSGHLVIRHLPEAGVCCPARYYQVCDDFEMGKEWWNYRTPKL